MMFKHLGTELYQKSIKERNKVQGECGEDSNPKVKSKSFSQKNVKNDTQTVLHFIIDMQKTLHIEKQNLHCIILKLLDLDEQLLCFKESLMFFDCCDLLFCLKKDLTVKCMDSMNSGMGLF